MSNPIPPPVPSAVLDPVAEKIKALQYLFDVARQAPVPFAVHEQARQYAQFIADSFNTPRPELPVKPPATLAEAVAAAVAAKKEPSAPVENQNATPVDVPAPAKAAPKGNRKAGA